MKRKTIITQYAEMIENRLKSIKNIKRLIAEDNSVELNEQLKLETRSLHKLLTDSYYTKLLKTERKSLILQHVKGVKCGEQNKAS